MESTGEKDSSLSKCKKTEQSLVDWQLRRTDESIPLMFGKDDICGIGGNEQTSSKNGHVVNERETN